MQMSYDEAVAWVRSHSEDDTLDQDELEAAFEAVYDRPVTYRDREVGLWANLVAAVEEGYVEA